MLPTNVQALLDAIPTAEDGHVITSEYHNALRDAIRALAGLGDAPGVATHVLTLAPAFFPEDSNAWDHALGLASKGNNAVANGWFPVQLPDGARIARMQASCLRNPPTGPLTIRLIKQFSNELRRADGGDVVATVQFPATSTRGGGGPLPTGSVDFGNLTSARTFQNLQSSIALLPMLEIFTNLETSDGQVNPNNSLIDGDSKYLVEARLEAATSGNGSTQIARIQISYTK